MARLTSLPKDLPILNQALSELDSARQQIKNLTDQLNAVLKRLKDANIP